MPASASNVYSYTRVDPLYPEVCPSIEEECAFRPNIVIAAGTVIGQVSAASENEVQTLDFSGSGDIPTGGTFTLSVTGIDGGTFTTAGLAYNISNANLKIAIENLFIAAGYVGPGGVSLYTATLTGGAAPVDVVVTFSTATLGAALNIPAMTGSAAGLTSSGTATLTVTATNQGMTLGLWDAYVDGSSGDNAGLDVARGIAKYSFRTDNAGRVVFGASGTSPEYGRYEASAPVWKLGVFDTSQLTGLDAAGVADLGRLWSGTFAAGVLSMR